MTRLRKGPSGPPTTDGFGIVVAEGSLTGTQGDASAVTICSWDFVNGGPVQLPDDHTATMQATVVSQSLALNYNTHNVDLAMLRRRLGSDSVAQSTLQVAGGATIALVVSGGVLSLQATPTGPNPPIIEWVGCIWLVKTAPDIPQLQLNKVSGPN